MTQGIRLLLIATLAVWPTLAQAEMPSSDAGKCVSDLAKATSKFRSCELDTRAKSAEKTLGAFAPDNLPLEPSNELAKLDAELKKCAEKFSEDWQRTLKSYAAGTCGGEPFERVLALLSREAERVGQLIVPIEATLNVGCQATSAVEGATSSCPSSAPLTGNISFNISGGGTTTIDIHCYDPSGLDSNDAISTKGWSRKYSSSAVSCTFWGPYENSSGSFDHYTCTNWDFFSTHSVTTTGIQCQVVCAGECGGEHL